MAVHPIDCCHCLKTDVSTCTVHAFSGNLESMVIPPRFLHEINQWRCFYNTKQKSPALPTLLTVIFFFSKLFQLPNQKYPKADQSVLGTFLQPFLPG
jgi:hypothetical protein